MCGQIRVMRRTDVRASRDVTGRDAGDEAGAAAGWLPALAGRMREAHQILTTATAFRLKPEATLLRIVDEWLVPGRVHQ